MSAEQSDKKPKYDIKEILQSYRPLIVPELERIFPRKVTAEHMEKVYGKPRYEYDCAALTSSISAPAWELLDRKGKMWRPGLLFLVAEALGKSIDDVKNFVAICEGVHSATLLVDDIEDSSDLRRGGPAIHLMFGVDVAINCGNGMYYMPLMALKQFDPPLEQATLLRCYETYSFEMCQLHFGQGMDIWWHSGKAEQEPTTQQYLQMCACKTGTLARLSAKLSAIACGASDDQIEAIGCFAETIGVAFQIQDDILNLVGEKFGELKGVGEDIHEGKRTLMVLHSLQTADKAKAERLTAILNSHPDDQAVINEAIEIIKSTDSIEHARGVAKKIVQDAWIAVESSLPDSPAKDKLQAFARFLIDREI